jgi:hypothetical protein
MANKKGRGNVYLKDKIPIGALVHIKILDRIEELAIVVDANYGYVRYSWYYVHGITSGKYYHAYPNEVTWLKNAKEKGDEHK